MKKIFLLLFIIFNFSNAEDTCPEDWNNDGISSEYETSMRANDAPSASKTVISSDDCSVTYGVYDEPSESYPCADDNHRDCVTVHYYQYSCSCNNSPENNDTCPEGQERGDDGECHDNDDECTLSCPEGSYLSDDCQCVFPEGDCPEGQERGDDGECHDKDCPPNSFRSSDGTCICKFGYDMLSGQCKDPECPSSYKDSSGYPHPLIATVKTPLDCQFASFSDGYAFSLDDDMACCYGEAPKDDNDTCPPGYIQVGDDCYEIEHHDNNDTDDPHDCPTGYYYSYLSEQCEPFFSNDNNGTGDVGSGTGGGSGGDDGTGDVGGGTGGDNHSDNNSSSGNNDDSGSSNDGNSNNDDSNSTDGTDGDGGGDNGECPVNYLRIDDKCIKIEDKDAPAQGDFEKAVLPFINTAKGVLSSYILIKLPIQASGSCGTELHKTITVLHHSYSIDLRPYFEDIDRELSWVSSLVIFMFAYSAVIIVLSNKD